MDNQDDAALQDEQAAAEAFGAGFTGSDATADTPPRPAGETGATADPPAPTDTPVPRFRQVTEEEWERLSQAAAKIDQIDAVRDSAMGKIGRVEQALNELREARQGAAAITDDDLAELQREYPDLAGLAIFTKLKGTASAAPAGGGVDEAVIERMVQQRVDPVLHGVDERVERAVETRLLAREHNDWRDVVGLTADGKAVPTPYRDWLAKQPAEYQTRVGSSWDHQVVGESITRFKRESEAARRAAQGAEERRQRLAAAVPARGESRPAPGSTDQDDFKAGFESG